MTEINKPFRSTVCDLSYYPPSKKGFRGRYVLLTTVLLITACSSMNYSANNISFWEPEKISVTVPKSAENLTPPSDETVEPSFVTVNATTLLLDMSVRFPKISEKTAKIIVSSVISASKTYGVNPLILYSIGIVESGHRHTIEHKLVSITKKDKDGIKKKLKIRAVGWGGIVWEWHHRMLKEEGIAKTRKDLFSAKNNINAVAVIYSTYYNMELKKGTDTRDESAQRRYFGGNYKTYSDKIKAQVAIIVTNALYT